MTIFYGARDLLEITEAVTGMPRRRGRLRRFWARHRAAIRSYAGWALFVLAIMAAAGFLDGPPR